MLNQVSDQVLEKAIEKLSYFDTLRIWIPLRLEGRDREALELLCGHLIYRPIFADSSADQWMRRAGFKAKLVLEQPSRAAIGLLQNLLLGHPRPLINRVDCALDFLTASRGDARELQLYVDARWLKPYHRPEHGVTVYAGTTTYMGLRNHRTKHVTYSDLPSRHGSKTPCCHLECRFQTLETVCALGIQSLDDLLRFDHPAFWESRLRLCEYDTEDLGKRWQNRHLSSAPRIIPFGSWTRNMDAWTGNVLCRTLISTEDADEPILMDVIARFAERGISLERVLIPLDNRPLLVGLRTAA